MPNGPVLRNRALWVTNLIAPRPGGRLPVGPIDHGLIPAPRPRNPGAEPTSRRDRAPGCETRREHPAPKYSAHPRPPDDGSEPFLRTGRTRQEATTMAMTQLGYRPSGAMPGGSTAATAIALTAVLAA